MGQVMREAITKINAAKRGTAPAAGGASKNPASATDLYARHRATQGQATPGAGASTPAAPAASPAPAGGIVEQEPGGIDQADWARNRARRRNTGVEI